MLSSIPTCAWLWTFPLADGSMDQFVAEANELAAGDTASLVDGEIVADEK